MSGLFRKKFKSILSILIIMGLSSVALYLSWFSFDAGIVVSDPLVSVLRYASIIALGAMGIFLYLMMAGNARMLEESTQSLKATNTLLESRMVAMELTVDGIFIVSKEGLLKYMNQSLMDLHGIKKEFAGNYIDSDWMELYPLEIQSQIQATVVDHLYDHKNWTGEIKLGTTDPKTIELALTKLPDGGLIGTSHDISNRKKAREEHEQLQSQFYQAQKMEAIGRLAGGIAHDFNNILAAISGYAEFLYEDLEDRPTEQNFADKILGATGQAKKLVDQILTFSRRNDSKSENIEVVALLNENLSMIKAGAASEIDIKKIIKFDQAVIDGNPTQISQTIMNLCVNAIDAMEGKRGKLVVELRPTDLHELEAFHMIHEELPDIKETPTVRLQAMSQSRTVLTSGVVTKKTPYLCLSVSDTGTGMSRAIMERVFEPFFTTKSVDKGTGLGLSTVHGVVMQNQGAMLIDSVLGVGTKFDLYFPMKQGSLEQNQGQEIAPLAKFEFEGTKILLVEDQESVRDMASRMLMRMGFDVIEAETGLHALKILRQYQDEKRFDLVLTDHSMPKMTGLELAIEASAEFPDLPFVLLSGYSEEKLQSIMKDHDSIKAVLRKPISKDVLKEKLYMILSGEDIAVDIDPIALAD